MRIANLPLLAEVERCAVNGRNVLIDFNMSQLPLWASFTLGNISMMATFLLIGNLSLLINLI